MFFSLAFVVGCYLFFHPPFNPYFLITIWKYLFNILCVYQDLKHIKQYERRERKNLRIHFSWCPLIRKQIAGIFLDVHRMFIEKIPTCYLGKFSVSVTLCSTCIAWIMDSSFSSTFLLGGRAGDDKLFALWKFLETLICSKSFLW